MMGRKGRVWSGHGDGLPGRGGGIVGDVFGVPPRPVCLASLLAALVCSAQLGGSSSCSLITVLPSVTNMSSFTVMALCSLQSLVYVLLISSAVSLGSGALLSVIVIVIPISQTRRLRCGAKGHVPRLGVVSAEL